ncbi:MAG: Sulfurtransferase TusA [Alphaproteobacteria bacterium MarineAlpha3_Bin4]|nr:MAG: Sulfurtransferase TusA [Alphaproteobacteria bacterium MarineAlpha3_Bin4]
MAIEIDTKGSNCPTPIIKTKMALKKMETGEEVRVETTDPASIVDFEEFCRATGNTLVESSEEAGVFVFIVRKTA